ncbi:MAG: hypothetical protein ACI8TA_000477 [Cyclobacteriaceae bacterium]
MHTQKKSNSNYSQLKKPIMKKPKLKIIAMVTLVIFAISCGKQDDSPQAKNNNVQFSFSVVDDNSGGRVATANPAFIVVTIENIAGDVIYAQEQLNVIEFNGSYISEPLSLLLGDYQLTEYIVTDAAGSAIYSTPLEGSELAYLVSDPLPIAFTIAADQSVQVNPQVISTENVTADQFGYPNFTFDFVETFDFLLSVFAFDETSSSYLLTSANVIISGDGTELYNKPIAAETDQIKLLDGYVNYTISVSKSAYITNDTTITNAQIKAYLIDPIEMLLTLAPPPPSNYALKFNAAQYIRTLEASELDLTDGAFTIEFWASTTGLGNSFLGKDNDNSSLDYQIAVGGGGGWNFRGQGGNDFGLQLDAPQFLGHNAFHHLAFTYDGAIALMYVDGSVVSTDNTPAAPTLNDFDLVIGGRSGGSNGPIQFWSGYLDEFRIWDVARTSTEINNNMGNSLVGNESGLVVYYDFNDGPESTSVTDRSGGNDGTLVNFNVSTDWVTNTPF